VSAWWVLGAFLAGGYAGILLMALVAAAREAGAEDGEPRHGAVEPLADQPHFATK
jgi:hypothetical protein